MAGGRRLVFLLNGTRTNWQIGKSKGLWGLPLRKRKLSKVLAELQDAGFAAGAEVLGIVGPAAYIRAVVGSDRGVYRDDESAPWGMDSKGDTYPVRIELTKIQEINQPWYVQSQGEDWRAVLVDRYFSERSLYVLSAGVESDPHIDWRIVLGESVPPPDAAPAQSNTGAGQMRDPQAMEDCAADLFADIGFRVEQLGHKRPYQRVPDGLACLPSTLSEHLQRMNEKSYFILWDCKFDCGPLGLAADDERAIREYATDFARQSKLRVMAPEFWFLIVARTPQIGSRIQTCIGRASWPEDLRAAGCLGVKTVSLDWLYSVASKAREHRRGGNDPDRFLDQEIPRMLKGLNPL